MGAVSTGFFFSLTEIPQQVRMGTLDFVLVRPVDPQFWVSLRRLAPEQAGVALVGLGMVFVGLRIDGAAPDLGGWAPGRCSWAARSRSSTASTSP